MLDELTIRPFEDEDIDEVLEVLRLALGETPLLQRTPELFAWKHFDNPFGRSIILLAEAEGRIAGVRAFLRWELLTKEGDLLHCVRPVDTATHPDYQRRGIFRRLTLAAVEVARDEGVDLVFNTPNPRSGAGYLSMGWEEVGPIGAMVRPSLGLLGGTTRETAIDFQVSGANVDLEMLDAQEDRPLLGLRSPRTSAYLEWRFAHHPSAGYVSMDVADGVAVVRPNTRRGRRELVVSDVFGRGRRAALRAAVRHSRAEYGVTWFSGRSPERKAALLAGFVPLPGVRALTLMALPLRQLPVDVLSLRSWDLALSDLELL